MPHRHQLKVRFYELDPYNHVNHSAIIQYFEVGRVELLESIGLGLDTMQEGGNHIVVTAIETRFLQSAAPNDTLVVETEIVEMRRATSTWRQRLLRGGDVIATQTIHAAFTDRAGRPRRFPPEMTTALESFLAAPE
jgi:acyl-CoA thioester hydrolase